MAPTTTRLLVLSFVIHLFAEGFQHRRYIGIVATLIEQIQSFKFSLSQQKEMQVLLI